MAEDTGQPAEEAAPDTDAPADDAPTTDVDTGQEAEKPTTALEDTGADDEPTPPSTYPDDWRSRMAARVTGKAEGEEYEKELKRLERAKSPDDVFKWYRDGEKRFSRGPEPFPQDGTDEEKAAWRKENGIPPEGYELEKLDLGGLEIGDDDKPMVEEYLKDAHEKNLSPEAVKANIDWYFGMREQQASERRERDEQDKTTARDSLRDELGPEFQPSLAAAYGLVEGAPDDVKEQLMGARLPDGTALGNHAPTLRWLMDLATEVNPGATVTPGSAAQSMQSINSRIAEIDKMIEDRDSAYWQGPKEDNGETAIANEYQRLLEAQEKMERKSK